jgi:hypothetical protein
MRIATYIFISRAARPWGISPVLELRPLGDPVEKFGGAVKHANIEIEVEQFAQNIAKRSTIGKGVIPSIPAIALGYGDARQEHPPAAIVCRASDKAPMITTLVVWHEETHIVPVANRFKSDDVFWLRYRCD